MAGASRVPAQMWQARAESRRRCGWTYDRRGTAVEVGGDDASSARCGCATIVRVQPSSRSAVTTTASSTLLVLSARTSSSAARHAGVVNAAENSSLSTCVAGEPNYCTIPKLSSSVASIQLKPWLTRPVPTVYTRATVAVGQSLLVNRALYCGAD